MHRGKWTENAVKLLDIYDIEIDFSIRGIENHNDKKSKSSQVSLLKKFIIKINNKIKSIKHRITVWKSLR